MKYSSQNCNKVVIKEAEKRECSKYFKPRVQTVGSK
jgi:hypothetical protein